MNRARREQRYFPRVITVRWILFLFRLHSLLNFFQRIQFYIHHFNFVLDYFFRRKEIVTGV